MKKLREYLLIGVFIALCVGMTAMALDGILQETSVIGLAWRLLMLFIVGMHCLFVFWAAAPCRSGSK